MDNKRWMERARYVAESLSNNVAGRKTSVVFVNDDNIEILVDANRLSPSIAQLQERFWGPSRYNFVEHAERNAVYYAAKHGLSLKGTTAYLPWFPCVDCARCLALVGVKRMVCVEPDWDDPKYSFRDAEAFLRESGVIVEYYKE